SLSPLILFCSCSGAPRALHSFPTRRSSDLRPALAAGEHLVNDKVESDLASHVCVVPFGPGDREGDAVALIRAAPAAPDRPRHAGAVARAPHAHRPRVPPLGHDEETADVAGLLVAQVQLQAIRVNVLRLVVE